MSKGSHNKGQAWGSARKKECPHCGAFKGAAHIRICKKNPDCDHELLAKKTAALKRNTMTKAESSPDPKPDPKPEPKEETPTPPAAAPVETPKEAEPPRPPADFMAARVAELRANRENNPQPSDQQPASVPVMPSSVAATPKRGIGKAAMVKLVSGLALIGLGFVGFKIWLTRRRPNTGESTMPEPQTYQGPRAWSPEPTKISPNDYVPYEGGGGYVPSPQSAWGEEQKERLKQRMAGN